MSVLRLRALEAVLDDPSILFARRAIATLIGLGLLAFAAAAALALATWTVDDPSLTHATDAPVQNMMGAVGAMFADPVMQLFGLAAPLLLLPPVLWGTRLIRGRPLGLTVRKVGAGIAALMLAPAFFNVFPVTESWPLPLGLGGVVGGLTTFILVDGFGITAGLVHGLIGGLLGVAALGCLWAAASPPRPRTQPADLGFQIRRSHYVDGSHDDYGLDESDAYEEEVSRLAVVCGWVAHQSYLARTALADVLKKRTKKAPQHRAPGATPNFGDQPPPARPRKSVTPSAPARSHAAPVEPAPAPRPQARGPNSLTAAPANVPATQGGAELYRRRRAAAASAAPQAISAPAVEAAPAAPPPAEATPATTPAAAPAKRAARRIERGTVQMPLPSRGPAARLSAGAINTPQNHRDTLGVAPNPDMRDVPLPPPSEAGDGTDAWTPAPVPAFEDHDDAEIEILNAPPRSAVQDDDEWTEAADTPDYDDAYADDADDEALDDGHHASADANADAYADAEDFDDQDYDDETLEIDEDCEGEIDDEYEPEQGVVDFDDHGDYDDDPLTAAAFQHAGPTLNASAAAASPNEAPQFQRRVARPVTEVKPGRRVVREAQPSFLDVAEYAFPPLALLAAAPVNVKDDALTEDVLDANARVLEGVLDDFGVKGSIMEVRPGPVVTLYELEPAPGIKSSRVIGLADDIARSMSAISARVAVIPGKNAIGIELPNDKRVTVFLRELLASQDFERTKAKLPLCLGKTIGGEAVIADLARMPHLLVAGTTGSGKSVSINTMILSLLYHHTPEECRIILIDPKMLELSVYDDIPHLLTPVVTDPKKAVSALRWAVREMEDRYRKMAKLGVRNIDGFNTRIREAKKTGEPLTRIVQTGFDKGTGEAIFEEEHFALETMPFIVVIVDEMADLMMVAGKDIEAAIQRLAQMARAAGIHLIMATQRPSVDVITGTIKANFPTRISFQVTSKIDSRTILGEMGAEQLLGMGDMLYMAGGGRIQRVHGPFVSDEEVEDVVTHLKQQGAPSYMTEVLEDDGESAEDGASGLDALSESDDLYDRAVALVLRDRKASTSYVQRRLSIGYNRAATLIERMENEGVVSPANHAGKREILVPAEGETI